MTGIDVLRLLLLGSFGNIAGRLRELSDDDWDRRAVPGTSKAGFILWHAARILDWTYSSIAGVPEVAQRDPWRRRFPQEAMFGAGIPVSVADGVTQAVSRTDTIAYLDDVKTAFLEWFDLPRVVRPADTRYAGGARVAQDARGRKGGLPGAGGVGGDLRPGRDSRLAHAHAAVRRSHPRAPGRVR
ncbi:MAG: hypothetical protein E6J28_15080, partial [Chloroflexi bacterium]